MVFQGSELVCDVRKKNLHKKGDDFVGPKQCRDMWKLFKKLALERGQVCHFRISPGWSRAQLWSSKRIGKGAK